MENIKAKISKLLALGERAGTEAEAEAAMKAAHRLLAEYNLDMDQVIASGKEKQEDLIADESTPSALRNTYWKDIIYAGVAGLYFCYAHTMTRRGQRFYCLTGRPSNIEVVKYIAQYVIRTGEELAKKEATAQAQILADEGVVLNTKRWKASFFIGFATRISQRAKEQIKAATDGELKSGDGRALALAPLYNREKAEIEKFQQSQGLKLHSSRRSASVRSRSGYEAGRSAADSVNLSANGVGSQQPKRIA